jgi:prepilin signal peptidase PulO-like enzyme (type II secretory pathway)
MIIPDELLLFSGAVLVVERFVLGAEIVPLLLDIVIPFIFMILIKLMGDFLFKKESLGGGDIKLMVIFGIALGWPNCIVVVALASFIALPISLIILAIKKTNVIPFGPFLSIAALILYYCSINYEMIINWLLNI